MSQPYMNPLYQQNILPPQQILTAKGKASIDKLRMSPNSSVLIADETEAIVWKCTSDGIGNVTAEPFDISPHKTEEQIRQDTMDALLIDMSNRLKKLEESYEQSNSTGNNAKQHASEYRSNQTSVGNSQRTVKSSTSPQSANTE